MAGPLGTTYSTVFTRRNALKSQSPRIIAAEPIGLNKVNIIAMTVEKIISDFICVANRVNFFGLAILT